MSYYWFNREKLFKNAWDKYHNKGGKQKAAEYLKHEISIETKKNKKITKLKKAISKRKIPHEY